MTIPLRQQLRTRLTLWYVVALGSILLLYVGLVFAFQYSSLKRQVYHDEIQDVETVEGLLSFDASGALHLQQDYFSHPRSHMLIDRLMEVRDPSGIVLYRSPTLNGMTLGGPSAAGEGDETFNEHVERLTDGSRAFVISHTHPVQGRVLLIRLGYNLAPFRERMTQFLGVLLIALPLTLLLAGFGGYALAKRALRPLEEMAARAETIGSSNLSERLDPGNPNDELGHMAQVLNHLLDRLDSAFAELNRFTGDAAHELRAPLACIRSTGELALRTDSRDPDHYRDVIGSMLEESSILNRTIDDLLILAKAESADAGMTKTNLSVVELTGDILDVLDVLLEEQNITVEQRILDDKATMVYADRGLIRAAIMNVLHNAVKFSGAHSRILIVFSEADAMRGFAQLSIEDGGPGIMDKEREQVFSRFFTSAGVQTSARAGSGIGLSIAKLAIERSGGEIFFDPSATHGARCIIRLPLRNSTTAPIVTKLL